MLYSTSFRRTWSVRSMEGNTAVGIMVQGELGRAYLAPSILITILAINCITLTT